VGRTLELEARHKDGHELPVELSLSAVQLSGRWCAVGIVRDISERKQLEKRAQSQLYLLQALMDAMPNPIYYKDTQLRYLGCNQAFEKLFGASKDQIVGKTIHDIAPEYLADAYHAADLELLARPHLQTYEGTLASTDGVDHNVLFRKAIFKDSEGCIGGIVGVLFDTGELARIQEALLVKDSVLNSAASGIVLTDLEGRVTYANPSCLRMWGFEHEQEVLNKPFLSLLQPREQGAAVLQSTLDTGAWCGDLAARRTDDSEFVVQVSASTVKDKQDKPICLMASLVDVTESRRISGILDRKQKNLEAIFDAAPLGMLLVDEHRRVVRANDTIRQISGKGYPEILNQHPCQALGCAHSETGLPSSNGRSACGMCPLQKLVEAAFESGSPVHGAETRLMFHRDDKETQPWFSVNLEPVNIDGDKHILIALHDITGRKQADEQLLETMEMKS
jgi:PAS domain S-box-containing protein